MGDNLFAGLNMDFNFADTLVPSQDAAAPHSAPAAPPAAGRHKRHKSSPDVLGQFSFTSLMTEELSSSMAAPGGHPQMQLPAATQQSIPFMADATSYQANPMSHMPTNPPPSTRGLSFIEDIDLEDILQDFLQVPDLLPSANVVPPTTHSHMMPGQGFFHNMAPMAPPHSAQVFHAHQLQENVLDLKRKSRHERHQSNPDGLFHHAQQLRQLQQQLHTQSQQLDPDPLDLLLPAVPAPPPTPSYSEMLNDPRSTHPPTAPAPPRRPKKRNESTGLSMDMSQIALDLHSESAKGGVDDAAHESNRKSYKCGRCGQPKVGHVCSLPDLRNNWSQADLAITRGMKGIDATCKVIASRHYTVVHPDHADHFFG